VFVITFHMGGAVNRVGPEDTAYSERVADWMGSIGNFVALAALQALAQEGAVPAETVAKAIARYDIDPDKPNPARS